MTKKRSKRNVLDIGYGGEPHRGTTIGIDHEAGGYNPYHLYGPAEGPQYTEPPKYGRSVTEPLEEIHADALHLPFKTGSLDRTTSQDAWQHDFPSKNYSKPDPEYDQWLRDRGETPRPNIDPYSQEYLLDFDPEEQWASLIESLRVLKPGGTTKHVWDGVLTEPARKDPYYLALIQLLKNHDMENIKIRLEDGGDRESEYMTEDIGYPVRAYYFHLTARKKR